MRAECCGAVGGESRNTKCRPRARARPVIQSRPVGRARGLWSAPRCAEATFESAGAMDVWRHVAAHTSPRPHSPLIPHRHWDTRSSGPGLSLRSGELLAHRHPTPKETKLVQGCLAAAVLRCGRRRAWRRAPAPRPPCSGTSLVAADRSASRGPRLLPPPASHSTSVSTPHTRCFTRADVWQGHIHSCRPRITVAAHSEC